MFLLNMKDLDADVDTDLFEPCISSLGQLFIDQHKMKVLEIIKNIPYLFFNTKPICLYMSSRF